MPSVLFVCTANRFRSPLAAAWFQRCLEQEAGIGDWVVGSAGTWAESFQPAIPPAKWMADHFGVHLESHRSIGISRELISRYDLILVMENSHQEALLVEFPELHDKLFLLTKAVDGIAYDVPDPAISHDETYLDIAKEITALIDRGFQKICFMARQIESHA
ncbi:hypothetical protein MASR2M66_30130 [Chloroflexota bacterium]